MAFEFLQPRSTDDPVDPLFPVPGNAKFKQGGGWKGMGAAGIAVAMTANAISNAAARNSTRGYSLVSHARYDWLASGAVMAQTYKWGKSQNALKIVFLDPTDVSRVATLQVWLEKREQPTALGRAIVSSAARRLAANVSGEAGAELETFATQLPTKPTAGGYGTYWRIPG